MDPAAFPTNGIDRPMIKVDVSSFILSMIMITAVALVWLMMLFFMLDFYRRAKSMEFEAFAGGKSDTVILMMDVDYFKQFNDGYGHELGTAF